MSAAETPAQAPPEPTIGRADSVRIAVATAVSAGTGYIALVLAARLLLPVSLNTQFVTFWSALFACFGVLSGMSVETTRAVTAARLAPTPDGSAPRRPRVLAVGLGAGLVLAAVLGASAPWWAPRLFPAEPGRLAALVCLAVAAFAAHSVVVGSLAGRRSWRTYSGVVAADSLVRLALVALGLVAVGTVLGAAAGAVAATLTWAGYLLVSREARSAAGARLDSSLQVFLRRVLAAGLASGASALLVVGFPVLLSATTPAAQYAGAAPLLLAISLTRAPLMIPLTAYQGVAVSHFVIHRDRGLRALAPIARLVAVVGVAGAGAAWLVGPWIMGLLGPGYRVEGPVLAGLTLAATAIALLTLTGALCQALTLHVPFLGGWVVAVVAAVGVLLTPLDIAPRAILALAAGPVLGVAVHLWALLRDVRTGTAATEAPPAPADAALAPDVPHPTPRVSVCLATYDGAAYVVEQLSSVLGQLGPDDEVVVVDDASRDDTVAVVRGIGDPRVVLVEHAQNRGYVRTFEEALRRSRGEYVLLCDQDDVWVDGRVAAMVEALDRTQVVATNLGTLGGPERLRGPYGQADWHLRAADSTRHVRNVLGILAGNRPYYGCAMGVRRSALARVLPFPALLTESHDLWIALYGNVAGSMTHLELRSVQRRFHEANASTARPRGPREVARSRWMLVRCVRELRRRRRA